MNRHGVRVGYQWLNVMLGWRRQLRSDGMTDNIQHPSSVEMKPQAKAIRHSREDVIAGDISTLVSLRQSEIIKLPRETRRRLLSDAADKAEQNGTYRKTCSVVRENAGDNSMSEELKTRASSLANAVEKAGGFEVIILAILERLGPKLADIILALIEKWIERLIPNDDGKGDVSP